MKLAELTVDELHEELNRRQGEILALQDSVMDLEDEIKFLNVQISSMEREYGIERPRIEA